MSKDPPGSVAINYKDPPGFFGETFFFDRFFFDQKKTRPKIVSTKKNRPIFFDQNLFSTEFFSANFFRETKIPSLIYLLFKSQRLTPSSDGERSRWSW